MRHFRYVVLPFGVGPPSRRNRPCISPPPTRFRSSRGHLQIDLLASTIRSNPGNPSPPSSPCTSASCCSAIPWTRGRTRYGGFASACTTRFRRLVCHAACIAMPPNAIASSWSSEYGGSPSIATMCVFPFTHASTSAPVDPKLFNSNDAASSWPSEYGGCPRSVTTLPLPLAHAHRSASLRYALALAPSRLNGGSDRRRTTSARPRSHASTSASSTLDLAVAPSSEYGGSARTSMVRSCP